jgi:sugar/nucleoside kinase (ribokinase family)
MIDVISYGIVCLDYIWRVRRLPALGGGVNIDEEAAMIGGEALNTAYPLHRWGVSVALVGNALGDDDHSVHLRRLLKGAYPNDETLHIPYHPDATIPFCYCIATPDGHRTMFGKGFGERMHLSLDPGIAESARFFTIDSTGYWDQGKEAAALAARHGAQIVAMDCEEALEICDLADTLQTSSESLPFHHEEDEGEKIADWAKAKRDRHGATVLVTRGPDGCFVAEGEGPCYNVSAYPLDLVVDGTGSGDVFRAGYLYGRTQGWDVHRSVRFGSAAASFNCGAMGGCGGIAPLDAILARMDETELTAVS